MKYLPFFEDYINNFELLDCKDHLPLLKALCEFSIHGKRKTKLSKKAEFAFKSLLKPLNKSVELRKIRSEIGKRGGTSGTGESKARYGNSNAKKTQANASKTEAKQKQTQPTDDGRRMTEDERSENSRDIEKTLKEEESVTTTTPTPQSCGCCGNPLGVSKKVAKDDPRPKTFEEAKRILTECEGVEPNICWARVRLKIEAVIRNGWLDGDEKPIRHWRSYLRSCCAPEMDEAFYFRDNPPALVAT